MYTHISQMKLTKQHFGNGKLLWRLMDKFNMSSNNKTINENFRGGDFASSANALQNRPYHKTTSFYKYTLVIRTWFVTNRKYCINGKCQ